MKQYLIACTLGLAGWMSQAQAATTTIDAGSVYFQVDSAFLPGISYSASSGQLTFNLTGYTATSGVLSEVVYDPSTYTGTQLPITIIAKQGYVITGLNESISGHFSAQSGTEDNASAINTALLMSNWVQRDAQGAFVRTDLMGIDFQEVLHLTNGQSASGIQTMAHTLNTGVLPQTDSLALGGLMFGVGAFAQGNGSLASSSLNAFSVNVQTAAVPEPGSVALVLAGLGVVLMVSRRRIQA